MTTSARRGLGSSDVLLALAGVALVAALAYPRAERALMWRRAAKAQADVEAVQAAALAYREEAGEWPAPVEAGEIPPELGGRLPSGFSFRAGPYTLEWSRWESVGHGTLPEPPVTDVPSGGLDPAQSPPPDSVAEAQVPVETMGALTVHARDERVLAALLERFGAGRSFVRERSWTLVLPLRDGG